jgi:hypothetical protein
VVAAAGVLASVFATRLALSRLRANCFYSTSLLSPPVVLRGRTADTGTAARHIFLRGRLHHWLASKQVPKSRLEVYSLHPYETSVGAEVP